MPGPHRRTPALARLAVLACAALLLHAALAPAGFVGGAPAPRGARVPQRAEPEEPKAASEALVVVNEENTAAMASLIGGIAAALVGGPVLGLLGFAGAAFLARQGPDNDGAAALRGVATAGLETLNFLGGVDKKYEVTTKVSTAVGEQVDKVKTSSPEAAQIIDGVGGAINTVDKEVSIGSTLSSVVTSGSSIASDVVKKAIETNEKYSITDKIKDTIGDAVSKAQKKE